MGFCLWQQIAILPSFFFLLPFPQRGLPGSEVSFLFLMAKQPLSPSVKKRGKTVNSSISSPSLV